MKLYTTLFLMAAGCSIALADNITENQAHENALRFMEQGGSIKVKSRAGSPKLTKAMQTRGYYAFNIGDANEGYIISSASDRTQPVLGYSDHGTIDADNMPDPLKYWLDNIDAAVANIEAGIPQTKDLQVNNVPHVADKQDIAPLVTCKWNQGDPYNLLTPSYIDQNSGKYNEHSATGCVATATTQIMYYWKWPQEECKTIPSYTYNWSGNNRTTDELPPIKFNWDAMTDEYNSKSSQESKMAVAELMLYAGHGMKSGYAGATGATSGNALSALQNYFGYSKDAYNTNHLRYTFQEWEDLFYNEIAAGRPILMGADNYERTGGHEFVCDGYDSKNGLYHINWGWGGWDDGYFVLTVMAPDNQGIGGSTDANGYSMGQNICVNLRPAYDGVDEENVIASISLINAGQSKLRKDAQNTFSLNFSYTLRTILLHQYDIEHAFRLLSENGDIVTDQLSQETKTMKPADRYSMNASLKFTDLADGTYTLRGISREAGSEEWNYDENSDRNYIELVVNGDEMLVTVKPGNGNKLVVNSLKLVGTTTSGNWQSVVYNITNNGNDFYGETYMFVDGTRSSGNTISIRAGETADIYFKFKPNSSFGSHKFILSLATNTNANNVLSDIDRMYNNDCLWKADGSLSALPKVVSGQSYVVPEDAVALYLYGSAPRSISVSKTNPNLVLYLDEDAKLTSRVENIMRKYITNIVIGNVAKEAAFKDGYSLSVPKPFVAETVSYTRENIPTWSTLALPFDVTEISVDGEPVEWFTSVDDTDKNIFVKSFAGARSTQLRFSHAKEIKANTAYFVGVEGNLNGSSFNHTGKSVTFSATDATIAIAGENTDSYVVKGKKMLPAYSTSAAKKLYGIDESFENFVPVDKTEPFHAYVSSDTNPANFTIYYAQGETSGIEDVIADEADNTIAPETPVYNLMGVKVGQYADFDQLARGLYIVAGRKIAKF